MRYPREDEKKTYVVEGGGDIFGLTLDIERWRDRRLLTFSGCVRPSLSTSEYSAVYFEIEVTTVRIYTFNWRSYTSKFNTVTWDIFFNIGRLVEIW